MIRSPWPAGDPGPERSPSVWVIASDEAGEQVVLVQDQYKRWRLPWANYHLPGGFYTSQERVAGLALRRHLGLVVPEPRFSFAGIRHLPDARDTLAERHFCDTTLTPAELGSIAIPEGAQVRAHAVVDRPGFTAYTVGQADMQVALQLMQDRGVFRQVQ